MAAERRRRERDAGGRERRKGKRRREHKRGVGPVAIFLLFGAAPMAVAIYFFSRPEQEREKILNAVPEGAGGRAIKAGICLGVLIVLARLVLPAFHGASATLRGGLLRLRGAKPVIRVLLFPVELVVWLLWFVTQILFAVDAVLIVAAGAACLLLVVRIFKPDLLPDFLPNVF